MKEQLSARQRRRELLITLSYTIFSVLMIIVSTIEAWPLFYVPLIVAEMGLVWWSYARSFQTYNLRAFMVTCMTCINIFLYGIQGGNFFVLIPTLCVEFVLLSLYEIPRIMDFAIVQTILLFIYLLYRLFFIAQNAPDLYGALMVTGIFGHIAMQVILNICVVINLIPTTGITLPFLSYGGTSVVLLMAEIMIALSVSKAIRFRRPEQDLWGEMVRSSGRREK